MLGKHVSFLLLVFWNTDVPVSSSRTITGERNGLYNNIYKTENQILVTKIKSASLCVTFCIDNIDCHSVSFNSKDMRCQTFNRDFRNQAVSGVNEQGWIHYDLETGNNCNNGPTVTSVTDCSEVQNQGYNCSGVYTIKPSPTITVSVWCDVTIDSGRWTTIQKRLDGSVNFDQNWNTYRNGFGNPYTEYWIGNEALFELTKSGINELLILMENWNGAWKHALYSDFWVNNEVDKYRLFVTGFRGTAGDSLNTIVQQSGQQFSTRESDNDGFAGSCNPTYHLGGWWFKNCGFSDLNGFYHSSPVNTPYSCHWYTFNNKRESLRTTHMLIRKV